MSELEFHKNSYQRFTQAVALIEGALTLFFNADRLIFIESSVSDYLTA